VEVPSIHQLLLHIQHGISFLGVLLILSGVLMASVAFVKHFFAKPNKIHPDPFINKIRLNLTRILILGLEFIVAADLIGTTTAPDYYSVGIVASIVLIRTVLSFSLNKEISDLTKEEANYKR
jgi:uncharacterized membrane protein